MEFAIFLSHRVSYRVRSKCFWYVLEDLTNAFRETQINVSKLPRVTTWLPTKVKAID